MIPKLNFTRFAWFLLLAFVIQTEFLNAEEIRIYISANGNDKNPGTSELPLASLNGAKTKLIQWKERLKSGDNIEFILDKGEYHITEPFIFNIRELGLKDMDGIKFSIRSNQIENPVLKGSVTLKNWQILKDKAKLDKLEESVYGKIYWTDLNQAGITNFGDPTKPGERPDLYCNGKLQTLARWPNKGFAKAGLVKGKTELPLTYIKVRGTAEGVFEYTGDRQNRWINENDIRLSGYWYWDWSEEFQKVDKIDASTKTLFIAEPFHKYGFKDSLRYFGLNIFSEMDKPGEYYLDRQEARLYWFPPKGTYPNESLVRITLFDMPYMIEIEDCNDFLIEGITFAESRGSTVLFKNCNNSMLKNCYIERMGRDGIHILDGTGNGVLGCVLKDLGCSGIKMKGGDRKTLSPANHFVSNTVVEHFSVFKKTYEPAIHLEGCGMKISNNRFSYSSSSALRLEGNDFLIEYNKIDHVVNESDDQGGVDIFYNPSYQGIVIRYNHWADITGGVRHGAAGVRLDDMISGVVIYGNIFERCGAHDFGGVQIHGGKDNLVENNLFLDCNSALSFTTWSEERWIKTLDSPVITKKLYQDVDINSKEWKAKYPNLTELRKNPNMNFVYNNLIVGSRIFSFNRNGKAIEKNNTLIPLEMNRLSDFTNPETLKSYGLQPIPFEMIGPKSEMKMP